MENYKVIDNFLRPDIFKGVKLSLLSGKNPWGLKSGLAEKGDDDAISFGLNLYDNNQVLGHFYYSIVEPLVQRIEAKNIYRAIANLVPLPRKPITAGIHIDHNFPHNVLLYYVNTNNGYTILDPKGKNIKIKCIENRALIFNGLIPHTGVLQSDELLRLNVNITFETYGKL